MIETNEPIWVVKCRLESGSVSLEEALPDDLRFVTNSPDAFEGRVRVHVLGPLDDESSDAVLALNRAAEVEALGARISAGYSSAGLGSDERGSLDEDADEAWGELAELFEEVSQR